MGARWPGDGETCGAAPGGRAPGPSTWSRSPTFAPESSYECERSSGSVRNHAFRDKATPPKLDGFSRRHGHIDHGRSGCRLIARRIHPGKLTHDVMLDPLDLADEPYLSWRGHARSHRAWPWPPDCPSPWRSTLKVFLAAVPRSLSNLLLLCISLLLCSLVLEGLVVLVFGEQPKFPRRVISSTFGVRINEPNSTYRHKSSDTTIWFKINGQGMRADRDYSYRKPSNIKRIVSLGDSYTVGYEVAGDKTFSSVLERQLNRHGYQVEVLNAGVSGHSTAEEYLYLKRELLKYDPDLVLVGFYGNDLVDNVRTGLFRLEENHLIESAPAYLPMGRLSDFLNTNQFFNCLSERSNAFALMKEGATTVLKRRMVSDNIRNLDQAQVSSPAPDSAFRYERLLTAAILDRMYETTHAHHIPLVILCIPTYQGHPERLRELFPLGLLPLDRPGLHFLSGKGLLEPHLGRQQLYWLRSHHHWTPFAHEVAGRALADLILQGRLLDARPVIPPRHPMFP